MASRRSQAFYYDINVRRRPDINSNSLKKEIDFVIVLDGRLFN